MPKSIKIILFVGVIVILYSFLCRITGIYFFWESSTFGWVILAIGFFLLLMRRVKIKKATKRKSIWEKIGIGAILFTLVTITVVNMIMANSDAVQAAKSYISHNDSLRTEIGEIRGYGYTYSGSIQVSSDSQGEEGVADLNLIVKGKRKFKVLNVYLLKDKSHPWEVKSIQ